MNIQRLTSGPALEQRRLLSHGILIGLVMEVFPERCRVPLSRVMVCQKSLPWNVLYGGEGRREAGCGVTHPPLPGLLEGSLGDRRFEQIGHRLHVRYKDEASSLSQHLPLDAQHLLRRRKGKYVGRRI
jgi:hypothetical protein